MKKLYLMLLCATSLAALTALAGVPNTSDPKTFLGPTLKASYTNPLPNDTAVSILGEAGLRNFRIGATFGWALDDTQRVKLSAEYLLQRITYPFFAGNTRQWVDQGAIGAAYQYDLFNYAYQPQFNLSAFFSHAANKELSTVTGTFVDATGTVQSFVNDRRIAGSKAGGVAPGVSFHPWQGARLGADLNYDKVDYDTKFGRDRDAIGFGGTVRYKQRITDTFGLGLMAAVRRPFNNYEADLYWLNVPYFSSWKVGLAGVYTDGKRALPDTYNVLLSLDYIDECPQIAKSNVANLNQTHPSISKWTSKPAVYLPQVLAIPDQRVTTTSCIAPALIGTLPDLPDVSEDTTIETSTVFSGSGLTYSMSISPDPAPSDVTINPATGSIFIDPAGGGETVTWTVTVTATNSCGSASTSFDVTVPGD